MALKQPAVWSDFMTAIQQITAVLIVVCALAGPAPGIHQRRREVHSH